jgi:hypothetical protein
MEMQMSKVFLLVVVDLNQNVEIEPNEVVVLVREQLEQVVETDPVVEVFELDGLQFEGRIGTQPFHGNEIDHETMKVIDSATMAATIVK